MLWPGRPWGQTGAFGVVGPGVGWQGSKGRGSRGGWGYQTHGQGPIPGIAGNDSERQYIRPELLNTGLKRAGAEDDDSHSGVSPLNSGMGNAMRMGQRDTKYGFLRRLRALCDEYERADPQADIMAFLREFQDERLSVQSNGDTGRSEESALLDEKERGMSQKMDSLLEEIKSARVEMESTREEVRLMREELGRGAEEKRNSEKDPPAEADELLPTRSGPVLNVKDLDDVSPSKIVIGVLEGEGIPGAIVRGEYEYHKNSRNKARTRIYYRCKNRKISCPATIILDVRTRELTWGVRDESAHAAGCEYKTCAGGTHYKRVDEMKTFVLLAARDSTATATQIFRQLVGRFMQKVTEFDVACTQKQVEYWMSLVRGQRKGETYEELEKMPNIHDPAVKVNWLRRNVVGSEGFMLFASDKQIGLLCNAPIWLVDGTFNAAPAPFVQVLNIMAVDPWEKQEKYWPAAHIFMVKKSEEAYRTVISSVIEFTGSRISEKIVITDFEEALRNGIQAAFDQWHLEAKCRGCLFHFSQALHRAMQKMGRTTPAQKKIVRLLMWAPYMDLTITKKFIHDLEERDTGMEPFLKYFRNYWLRRSSWWMVKQWDWDIVTNCALEGYHAKLKAKGGALRKPGVIEISKMFFTLDHELISVRDYQTEFQQLRTTNRRRTNQAKEMRDTFADQCKEVASLFESPRSVGDVAELCVPTEGHSSNDLGQYMSQLLDDQVVPSTDNSVE